jgi:hypothetical protein
MQQNEVTHAESLVVIFSRLGRVACLWMRQLELAAATNHRQRNTSYDHRTHW